jgi:hypothetical protein
LFLFIESKPFSKSTNTKERFVRYSLLCSIIRWYYPHLYCSDPLLCGFLATMAWRILSLQMEKTASSYGG